MGRVLCENNCKNRKPFVHLKKVETALSLRKRPSFSAQSEFIYNHFLDFTKAKGAQLQNLPCGMSLLLLRASDPKSRGNSATTGMVRMLSKRPQLAMKLLEKITFTLAGKLREVALSRFQKAADKIALNTNIIKRVTFEVPVLQDKGEFSKLKHAVGKFVSKLFVDTGIVFLKFKDSCPPSVQSFCNINRYKHDLDTVDFTCKCDQLISKLKVPYDTSCGHVVIKGSDTMLAGLLPTFWFMHSPLCADWYFVRTTMMTSMQKLSKSMTGASLSRMSSLLPQLQDTTRACVRRTTRQMCWTASLEHLRGPLSALTDAAIVTLTDKAKSDVTLSCPRGYQLRCLHHVEHDDYDYSAPSVHCFERDFALLRNTCAYTRVRCPLTHNFGSMTLVPKVSCVRTKSRCLGSYVQHQMRFLFRLVCRAINILNHMMFMKESWYVCPTTTRSSAKVRSSQLIATTLRVWV